MKLGNLKRIFYQITRSCLFSAPKTYSLTNTAQIDTGGNVDKSILKV